MLILPQDCQPSKSQWPHKGGAKAKGSLQEGARVGTHPCAPDLNQSPAMTPGLASTPASDDPHAAQLNSSSQGTSEVHQDLSSDMSSRPVSAATTDSYLEAEDGKCAPYALDVLAALASMGVSDQLRCAVQEALDQIDAATASARDDIDSSNQPSTSKPSKQHAGIPSQPNKTLQPRNKHDEQSTVQSLEHKLSMSRSIMRKLYHRNVELEKEMQMYKANTSPISFTITTEEVMRQRQAAVQAAAQGEPVHLADDLLMRAFKERDTTVLQLQQALDAARRRCTLLESQLLSQATTHTSSKHKDHKLKDVLAQSHMHYTKYRQIRDDYNRLLNKRAGTLQSNRAASAAAKQLVTDLHIRLQAEVSEREAEAALYSAKLYETECKMSDWYVERRMLEEKISRLSAEMSQRDAVDAEIESCVCGLLERLKVVEAANQQLRDRLGITSEDSDTAA